MNLLESLFFSVFHQKAFRVLHGSVAAWLLLWGLTGCGLRGRPQPIIPDLPSVKEVTLHQKDGKALVGWWLPPVTLAEQAGGLTGFSLTVERLAAGCPACVPEETRTVWLPMGYGEMMVEGPQAGFVFPLPEQPAIWRVRLISHFGNGEGTQQALATMEGLVKIPTPEVGLKWLIVPKPGASKPGDVGKFLVFWPPQRERIVRVLEEEGNMSAREEFFRANIYRRLTGQPWPWWPQNDRPLTAGQWESSPMPLAEAGEELTVRFVDRFGNEGPAAAPVNISPLTDTP